LQRARVDAEPVGELTDGEPSCRPPLTDEAPV
jgi:hypothetical protein